MSYTKLSPMEIDAIGEILNISLGSSATAVSTMLDTRVDITTPVVTVRARDEFEFTSIEPAVGVEIGYVEGLDGNNIMLLKRRDVKVIVEMLMGMEIPDEEFELNEMNISAVCEVMNQMMGASATALSELLSKTVNISTPVSFEVESPEQFKTKYFADHNEMVVIGFNLTIEDKLESEFLNLMPIELAKELVAGFFPDGAPDVEEEASAPETQAASAPAPAASAPATSAVSGASSEGGTMSQEEIERLMQGMSGGSAPAAQPAPAVSAPTTSAASGASSEGGTMSQEEIERLMQGMSEGSAPAAQPAPAPAPKAAPAPAMQQGAASAPAMQASVAPVAPQVVYAQPSVDPDLMKDMLEMMDMMRKSLDIQQQQIKESGPRKLKVQPAPRPNLQMGDTKGSQEEDNLDMMMDVPMEVSVEIGRTRKLVKDILELNKGSLVVLDKLAGEQVDLFVNGQCIAKGDVVVVDDNFGIRITEIF